MGFLADLARSKEARRSPTDRGEGRSLWREIFAGSDKEDKLPKTPEAGRNSYTASATVGSDVAVKRLLTALRSNAPGTWSDDRWEQAKHYRSIVYTAIHRQNELLSQAEFQVFHKDPKHPDGKRPVDESETTPQRNGPYDLVKLLEKPNNNDSFGNLMEAWNLQLDLTGIALTWVVPNAFGTPLELYPIPTAIAIPQAVLNPQYPDGYYQIQPIYPYGPFSSSPTPYTSVGARIASQWMLRWMYPHPLLRYDGYSPLTGLNQQIDTVEQMDRSRWYKMFRSLAPSAVLNFSEVVGMQQLPEEEIERIREEWENEFQGTNNAGKLIVGTPGGTLEEWGRSPLDMDYPSGWDQLTSFVLGGGFGVTKPAAGMTEDSNYSTLWATLKQLYWTTLDPKCNRIASKLTRHLAPHYGDDLFIEIRCKRLDDHEVKLAKIDKLITAKAITKNEVRMELDMPVTEEEWGSDIAGDPSEKEQAQEMAQAASGETEQDLMDDPEGTTAALAGNGPGRDEDKAEQEKERPRPGKIAAGSLGPRKSLKSIENRLANAEKAITTSEKRVIEKLDKIIRNGKIKPFSRNGKH